MIVDSVEMWKTISIKTKNMRKRTKNIHKFFGKNIRKNLWIMWITIVVKDVLPLKQYLRHP